MKTKSVARNKATSSLSSKKRLISFVCAIALSASLVLAFDSIVRSSNVPDLIASSELFSAQGLNNSKANRDEIIQIVLSELRSISGGAIPNVSKVIIADNYALADWTLGESGGSALLMKKLNQWNLISSDGGILDSNGLQRSYRVPKKTADRLTQLQSHCYEYPSSCGGN